LLPPQRVAKQPLRTNSIPHEYGNVTRLFALGRDPLINDAGSGRPCALR
jgi:hypothetical protein